jgi:hypothetical protein
MPTIAQVFLIRSIGFSSTSICTMRLKSNSMRFVPPATSKADRFSLDTSDDAFGSSAKQYRRRWGKCPES